MLGARATSCNNELSIVELWLCVTVEGQVGAVVVGDGDAWGIGVLVGVATELIMSVGSNNSSGI